MPLHHIARSNRFVEYRQGDLVIADQEFSTGDRYWVDSGNTNGGATDGFGMSPDKPYSTLQAAVDNATADQGDIIYVMAGHTEDLTTAGNLDLNTAGITIIGQGWGTARPTFTLTETVATITITAANVRIENLLFLSGVDTLAAPLILSAAGTEIVDCEFRILSTFDTTIWITTDANCDDLLIQGCRFFQLTTGGTECILLIGTDRCTIRDCFIMGEWSTANINSTTTACLEILIEGNTLLNTTQDIPGYIAVAGSTGRCDLNVGGRTSAAGITDNVCITSTTVQLHGNYWADVVGETGKLIGTPSA